MVGHRDGGFKDFPDFLVARSRFAQNPPWRGSSGFQKIRDIHAALSVLSNSTGLTD